MGSMSACNSVCVPLERNTRLRDMQKIRLGHSSLLCVCVSAIATDTPLQCSLDFKCVLFVLSVLRVFLMSQMLMELNSTRSYHTSARHCK